MDNEPRNITKEPRNIAVNLQTPIMKSTRDRLKELQDEHAHENIGETIGWLIDGFDAMKDIRGE